MRIHYWKYFLFKCSSKYRHGVHSPFVFELVNYFHRDKKWQKIRRWPLSLKNFAQINTTFKNVFSSYINEKNTTLKMTLSFIDANNVVLEQIKNSLEGENHILVIESLFNHRKQWKKLTLKKSYVLIDFYFWGVCCHRKQIPQLFLIRIL